VQILPERCERYKRNVENPREIDTSEQGACIGERRERQNVA
jgi:hypothetical protein